MYGWLIFEFLNKYENLGGKMEIRITVLRKTEYEDLIKKYENYIENPCEMRLGDVFISKNGNIPENFCNSAWETIEPFVKELNCGGGNFYNGWMKNQKSALISCNDGFRPVSFLIEII